MSGNFKKKMIEGRVTNLVDALLWHDRNEDEWIPRGEIEKMVKRGDLTEYEIVIWFRAELRKRLPKGP